MLPTFQKWTFGKGLYGENDRPSMWGKRCEKHMVMRAYVECSPNQSKNYTLSTFPSNNRQNFEDSEKSAGHRCV